MTTTLKKERKRNKKRHNGGPPSLERHRLYELAVQSPELNVDFIDRVYRERHGCEPRWLKEDFCGTALLSREWVRARPQNRAVAVDLDPEVLAWGREHNVAALGAAAARLQLVEADVRAVREPPVDVVAAFNFSYYTFRTHRELRAYFEHARASLRPGGLLVLDTFGGWETQMEITDKTRHDGFTYVWQQERFNPVDHEARFHIHFKFHDGGGIRNAYTYECRMWGIPEIRDALEEAGFERVDVYWEDADPRTGEGSGDYRRVTRADNCPGWIAMIVAFS
jgi:SAM-dependent methyltransferase